MSTRGMTLGVLLAGLALGIPGISAADGPEAIATAAQHADLSAKAGDLAMVQRHLHHALNCLVGADGEGFDEAAGNPCGRTGAAIPQTADADMQEKLGKLAMQVREAFAGNASDIAALQAVAADVQKMLQE